jgi:hypothetical protein
MNDLAFFSFEHYPYDPCRIPWGSAVRRAGPGESHHASLARGRSAGQCSDVHHRRKSFIGSERDVSWIFSPACGWPITCRVVFERRRQCGLYYFHYLPLQMEHGCNDSPGTFGMFTVDADYKIQQPLAQFFVAQLINPNGRNREAGHIACFRRRAMWMTARGMSW